MLVIWNPRDSIFSVLNQVFLGLGATLFLDKFKNEIGFIKDVSRFIVLAIFWANRKGVICSLGE
ncbi:hypothetical protein A3B42_05045 [Candidatus Daviesbacteria bacterium RIFCSPLOWO2_01_FULL_38_10]|nr:MAG: hypothetical protein A3B42_05045 [Candidatus Daviesbacteria bacterium RIFCSPLOWO2_01_FULL_38_10]OGE68723.1 MAG: hypothetical protein A3H81_00525 [Candidatus Daviesbacteria bacterium RIFCSPLOWO2_02_FULL_38_18]OGE73013.1 MAG: hypothetical protein A3H18_00410 [Candidatus Daviesbacteria bacterium RIFCSPLOWO2_12_FULL_38_10]